MLWRKRRAVDVSGWVLSGVDCVCGVHFVWCVAWLMCMVYVGYVSGVYGVYGSQSRPKT